MKLFMIQQVIFTDLSDLPGGKNECRRVLLGRSKSFAGPFSKVLGNSVIELISQPEKQEKKYMKAGSGAIRDLSIYVMICVEWMN